MAPRVSPSHTTPVPVNTVPVKTPHPRVRVISMGRVKNHGVGKHNDNLGVGRLVFITRIYPLLHPYTTAGTSTQRVRNEQRGSSTDSGGGIVLTRWVFWDSGGGSGGCCTVTWQPYSVIGLGWAISGDVDRYDVAATGKIRFVVVNKRGRAMEVGRTYLCESASR